MQSGYDHQREWTKLVGAAALGVAAMYMLDPDKGKRRRALVGDQAYGLVADTRHALGAATRDAAHRIQGLRARARRLLTDAPVPDDLQLIERVRARMGRLVSHPHAIQVGANNGRVTLSGPILEHEVARLLDAIRMVWGVSALEDRLVVHDSPESISSLQDGTAARATPAPFVQEHWTPAARTAATLGGLVVSVCGMRQRSFVALALAGGGLALLLRGATNRSLATLASPHDASTNAPARMAVEADRAWYPPAIAPAGSPGTESA